MRWFLLDNLEYFIDLYRERGLSVSEALASEDTEIEKIRRGERGSVWSKIVVELNAEFYLQLRVRQPRSWLEVRQFGESIIDLMSQELQSLSPLVEM